MPVASTEGSWVMQNDLGEEIQWGDEIECLLLLCVRHIHLLDDLPQGGSNVPSRCAFQDVLSQGTTVQQRLQRGIQEASVGHISQAGERTARLKVCAPGHGTILQWIHGQLPQKG